MPRLRNCVRKYNISKHRFYELYHYCMQYNEWIDELKYLEPSLSSPQITDMPSAHSQVNPLEELAIKRAMLSEQIEQIKTAAFEADPEIYDYLLKGVTTEGVTYEYLRMVMRIPCGKNKYYAARRKFYWLMDRAHRGHNNNI